MVEPIIRPNQVIYSVHGWTRSNHRVGPFLKTLSKEIFFFFLVIPSKETTTDKMNEMYKKQTTSRCNQQRPAVPLKAMATTDFRLRSCPVTNWGFHMPYIWLVKVMQCHIPCNSHGLAIPTAIDKHWKTNRQSYPNFVYDHFFVKLNVI